MTARLVGAYTAGLCLGSAPFLSGNSAIAALALSAALLSIAYLAKKA